MFAGLNLKLLKMTNYTIALIIFYLIGYVVNFKLFLKGEEDFSFISGWGSVFLAAYFSLLSWIGVLMVLAFNSKSSPPEWLIKRKK